MYVPLADVADLAVAKTKVAVDSPHADKVIRFHFLPHGQAIGVADHPPNLG